MSFGGFLSRGPTVRGPTVRGPNCPGPNCPLFQGGQLGPGQSGPGAQLSGAQLSTFSRRTVGPRTVGPLDSWAPDNWAPGKYINLADICSRNVPPSDIYSPNIGNIYPMQIYGIFLVYTLGTLPPPPPQNLTKLFILVFICQHFGRVLIL